MSDVAAHEYLTHAVRLIRLHAYYAARVDWLAMLAAAGAVADDLPPADRYTWIREILRQLGDRHSSLVEPAAATEMHQGAQYQTPTGRLLADEIAYIDLPGVSGDEADPSAYATAVHALLRALRAGGARGWIVDLRRNSGGNLGPMLAGIGPLLGAEPESPEAAEETGAKQSRRPHDNAGVVGGFRAADGSVARWLYRAGAIGLERWILARAADPLETLGDQAGGAVPVAVLTGPLTRSSGELTLVAFRGRPNTRSFGEPTAGVPTSNEVLALPDGAEIFLTTNLGTDRAGQSYEDALPPDEPVPIDWAQIGTPADPVIARAVAWLRQGAAN